MQFEIGASFGVECGFNLLQKPKRGADWVW